MQEWARIMHFFSHWPLLHQVSAWDRETGDKIRWQSAKGLVALPDSTGYPTAHWLGADRGLLEAGVTVCVRGQWGGWGRTLTRSFCIMQDLHISFYLSGIQIDLGGILQTCEATASRWWLKSWEWILSLGRAFSEMSRRCKFKESKTSQPESEMWEPRVKVADLC